MSDSVKQRLIGAIVLLIVAACLWPVIFKPAENPSVVLRSKIPDAPELQVFEIPRQQAPDRMPDVATEIESERPKIANFRDAESIGEENIAVVDNPATAETLDLTTDQIVVVDAASEQDDSETELDRFIATNLATDSQDAEPLASNDTTDNAVIVDAPATVVDVVEEPDQVTTVETTPSSESYGLEDATTPDTYATYEGPMWALQAGAFGDASNAERLADELRAKNFSVIVQRRFGSTRMLAFVMVGPYFNLDNARSGIVELEQAGYKSTLAEFAP